MQLLLLSTALLGALAQGAAVYRQPETVATKSDPCANRIGIEQVMIQWGAVWKGDFSMLEQTVEPNIAVYQDKVPFPGPSMLNGTASNPFTTRHVGIDNQEKLMEYVRQSSKNWAKYGFRNYFHFANANGTALVSRWTLDAIVGEGNPTSTRKPGDHVSMNGTDIVMFHECTGRIKEVATAQDMIRFTEYMGMDVDLPNSPRLL